MRWGPEEEQRREWEMETYGTEKNIHVYFYNFGCICMLCFPDCSSGGFKIESGKSNWKGKLIHNAKFISWKRSFGTLLKDSNLFEAWHF